MGREQNRNFHFFQPTNATPWLSTTYIQAIQPTIGAMTGYDTLVS